MSGTLPSSTDFWHGLRSLHVLNVDDNRLGGSIPSEIATLGSGGLVSLELSDNRLSGAPRLPVYGEDETNAPRKHGESPSEGTATRPGPPRCPTHLTTLTQHNDGSAGTLPTELAALPTAILSVYGNARLTGIVPPGVQLSTKWFSTRFWTGERTTATAGTALIIANSTV